MIAKLKFHLKLLFSYISLFNMSKYVNSSDSSQEDMFSLESIEDYLINWKNDYYLSSNLEPWKKSIEFVYENKDHYLKTHNHLTDSMHFVVLKIKKRKSLEYLKEMERKSFFPPGYIGPKAENCFMKEWR